MLPVMYYSRQLDAEDPNVVFMLRCSYAAATVITLLMIAFLHTKVSSSTDADTGVKSVFANSGDAARRSRCASAAVLPA